MCKIRKFSGIYQINIRESFSLKIYLTFPLAWSTFILITFQALKPTFLRGFSSVALGLNFS